MQRCTVTNEPAESTECAKKLNIRITSNDVTGENWPSIWNTITVSVKTNALLNLISYQPDTGKVFLYVKDQNEPKHRLLINKGKEAGLKDFRYSKNFWNSQVIWIIPTEYWKIEYRENKKYW